MDETMPKKKTEPSPVWEHYSKFADGGKCNYCAKVLKSHNSTSNLLNHLRSQHTEQWELIKHHYPKWENYVPPEKKPKAQSQLIRIKVEGSQDCSLDHVTGELIEYEEGETIIMADGTVTERKKKKRGEKSPVWQHFTRHELGGQCNYCGILLKSYSSTSNLLNHLKNIHPEKWDTLKHLYPERDMKYAAREARKAAKLSSTIEILQVSEADGLSHEDAAGRTGRRPKPGKSPVWRFFERINNQGLCKCLLCGKLLKSFNSTSSLLAHMKRHPNAWGTKIKPNHAVKRSRSEMVEVKTEFSHEETTDFDIIADGEMILYEPAPAPSMLTSPQPKMKKKVVAKAPNNDHAIDSLVRFVVKGEMSLSLVEMPDFRQLLWSHFPEFEISSQVGLRNILEDKVQRMGAILKNQLEEASSFSLAISEWTDASIGRNFIGITCNYIQDSELKSATVGFEELFEGLTEELLVQRIEAVCEMWHIAKAKVESFTVTGSTPLITNIFSTIFGADKQIFCFAHALNLIAKKPFEELVEMHAILDAIKQITDYLKQGDEIMVEDYEEGQQFWDLIYTTPTTWKGLLSQLDSFINYWDKIEVILSDQADAPTINTETINDIKDVVKVFKPLSGVVDELGLEDQLSASKVIPLVQCMLASYLDTWPETQVGIDTKEMILEQTNSQFGEMEESELLAMATLIDPRFKRNYFKKPHARDLAVAKLKEIITVCNDPFEAETVTDVGGGIWKFHTSFVDSQATSQPHPVTLYLSTKVSSLLDTDPIRYFSGSHTELRSGAEKLLVSMATSTPPRKIFSESGNAISSNWTTLPIHDLRRLMFLKSVLG